MSQTLPRQVREELEQAEELEKALLAEQEAANAAPEAEPEPEVAAEAETEEPEAVAQEPEPVEEPVETVEEEPRTGAWENKYKALQGKYDVEVPRLHQQNRDLAGQISELQSQITALSETAQESKPETQPEKAHLVTDRDEEEFGSEMIDLNRRVAREEIAARDAKIAELEGIVRDLAGKYGKLNETTQQTAGQSFEQQLATLVPDWREIDQNPAWLEWLAEVDPITGKQRQAHLDVAHKALDAQRVANIFNTFADQTKPAVPTPKSELNKQVTPKKSAAPNAPSSQPKVWTQAEIADALDPRKLRHMTTEQIDGVMSEIDAAQREGRVTL